MIIFSLQLSVESPLELLSYCIGVTPLFLGGCICCSGAQDFNPDFIANVKRHVGPEHVGILGTTINVQEGRAPAASRPMAPSMLLDISDPVDTSVERCTAVANARA